MIELSSDQIRLLQNGDQAPPTMINPQTKEEFVLIRGDVFERLRALLDDEFRSQDAFLAQIESAAAAGWDDPALDIF